MNIFIKWCVFVLREQKAIHRPNMTKTVDFAFLMLDGGVDPLSHELMLSLLLLVALHVDDDDLSLFLWEP